MAVELNAFHLRLEFMLAICFHFLQELHMQYSAYYIASLLSCQYCQYSNLLSMQPQNSSILYSKYIISINQIQIQIYQDFQFIRVMN